jgi:signal transduction histidine kinase
VGLQKPRSDLHLATLAQLGAFMAWTAGLVLAYLPGAGPATRRFATLTCFFGVMLAAPIWAFVCARVARLSAVSERPRAALAGLLAPSALNFAALATDPLHGLFARGETLAVFTAPVREWAGPFFWLHVLWSYGCAIGGVALCIVTARRAANTVERKRLYLVALAASVPVVSIAILMSGLTTPATHPTPADIGLSAALLVAAIVRYRFLEPSPIAAREILSHLQDGLLLMDGSAVILDANPAALQILQRPLEQVRGRTLKELVGLLDGSGRIELAADPLGGAILPPTALATHDDRMLDLSAAAVCDSAGRSIGQFFVIRDRTAQHRLEKLQQRSQRLESLSVLAAGIAHEINNPLAFVRTNLAHLTRFAPLVRKHAAQVAAAERGDLEEIDDILRECLAGVDRIAAIVAATRRLSRQPDPGRALVDLNRVCEEALGLVAFGDGRGIAVETHFERELPAVRGSADQLGQAILNLLINAQQAVRALEHGRVRVATRAVAGAVEVSVHDNGAGVAPENRERIFDPFFTTKGPDEGTGLGLAIAHEVARFHEGTLEVAASELGGARFSLRLPLDARP